MFPAFSRTAAPARKQPLKPRPAPAPAPAPLECAGVVISRLDRERLYESLPYAIPLPEHLAEVLHRLASARAVDPRLVPPDLVTMNSVVRLRDPRTGEAREHTLVYPYQADLLPMGTSIAAPAGAALFGRRTGDHTLWRTPRGASPPHIAIIESLLYQPEREGDYDR